MHALQWTRAVYIAIVHAMQKTLSCTSDDAGNMLHIQYGDCRRRVLSFLETELLAR